MEKDFDISSFLRCQMLIGEVYKKIFARAATECNISKPEADVLVFLSNNPQWNTARDIVEYRGFSKAYVSKAVEQLLAKELICIQVSKTDRRYQYLEICPKSAEVIELLRKAQKDFIEKIVGYIGKQDANTFAKTTQKLLDNIKKGNITAV